MEVIKEGHTRGLDCGSYVGLSVDSFGVLRLGSGF